MSGWAWNQVLKGIPPKTEQEKKDEKWLKEMKEHFEIKRINKIER